jgi:hypothetical protein
VQDTGPDGAKWTLAARGVDVTALSGKDLILLWTVPSAPASTAEPTSARWRPAWAGRWSMPWEVPAAR